MKILKMLPTLALSLVLLQANAQTDAPKGFAKGSIVLPDNSVVKGFIRDNMRNDASVTMLRNGTEKSYSGSDINAVEIDGTGYTCIKGDFFKVVADGELKFLQKSSDASSKPSYNGGEVSFISGTAGKTGDYFIYNNQELKLVSKKTLNAVIAASFGGYSPAVDKAKEAQGNIAQLKDAVDVFNKRNGK